MDEAIYRGFENLLNPHDDFFGAYFNSGLYKLPLRLWFRFCCSDDDEIAEYLNVQRHGVQHSFDHMWAESAMFDSVGIDDKPHTRNYWPTQSHQSFIQKWQSTAPKVSAPSPSRMDRAPCPAEWGHPVIVDEYNNDLRLVEDLTKYFSKLI